jgi:branched-chain amino acid transport system permease protein
VREAALLPEEQVEALGPGSTSTTLVGGEGSRHAGWRAAIPLPFVADGAVVAVALALPLFVSNGYVLRVLALGCIYGALAMGVVVSYGYAGVPNMSQGALYGIGAYLAANLMVHTSVPFLLVMLASGVGTAVAGGLLGTVALRIKGSYWWLVTIAFAEVMHIVFNSWTPVTGGVAGFLGIPIADVGPVKIDTQTASFYLGLGVVVVCYVVFTRWGRSRVGLAARAVRADETAARGLGLSPGALKITGLALAGFAGGLAGAALDAITGFIDATTFSIEFSITILLITVVGGLRSLRGALAAAVVLTYVTTEVSSLVRYQDFVYGGVVLVALFLRLYLPELRALVGASR